MTYPDASGGMPQQNGVGSEQTEQASLKPPPDIASGTANFCFIVLFLPGRPGFFIPVSASDFSFSPDYFLKNNDARH
jgi:hypothetical protein